MHFLQMHLGKQQDGYADCHLMKNKCKERCAEKLMAGLMLAIFMT